MKVILVVALVIAVIALGLGWVAFVRTDDLEELMTWENTKIVREVEAIGGWTGEFIELQVGQTIEGYISFAYFSDREDAERFVKSLANIKEYGIMAIQPDDGGWRVYREIPS